ncbi:unnamed protein product [Camellia sinensis]
MSSHQSTSDFLSHRSISAFSSQLCAQLHFESHSLMLRKIDSALQFTGCLYQIRMVEVEQEANKTTLLKEANPKSSDERTENRKKKRKR